jgi:hypothetical protein
MHMAPVLFPTALARAHRCCIGVLHVPVRLPSGTVVAPRRAVLRKSLRNPRVTLFRVCHAWPAFIQSNPQFDSSDALLDSFLQSALDLHAVGFYRTAVLSCSAMSMAVMLATVVAQSTTQLRMKTLRFFVHVVMMSGWDRRAAEGFESMMAPS